MKSSTNDRRHLETRPGPPRDLVPRCELDRARRDLDALTYSVSHDLRAPLRALTGFASALTEDCSDQLDEMARGYVVRIHRASARLTAMVDGLLALSRASRADLRSESVDMSEIVTQILREHAATDPARHVTVHVEHAAVVWADRDWITVALAELLDNAWKFTEHTDDARVDFAVEAGGPGRVRCRLSDNGAGFDATYADKLGQPFQRVHTESEFPGLGVGLALARTIIERQDGTLRIVGVPGHGATVVLEVPAPMQLSER
jgi:signal transduction histidine kinase